MSSLLSLRFLLVLSSFYLCAVAYPASVLVSGSRNITSALFEELEELSRIVDISYCVGSSGIQKPFQCLGRCSDFEGFELVTTWNTGPLLSDSCGYIALSHPPFPKRIVLAFRGTYSIANTVVDLSTYPAQYVPFPGDGSDLEVCANVGLKNTMAETFSPSMGKESPLMRRDGATSEPECENCTVHAGFLTSWTNTRCLLIPHLENLISKYPDYQLTLVGHSLGGAVAALASLEFLARGWDPHVTTFGEPRIGNQALNRFFDDCYNLSHSKVQTESKYRRVTHVNDPVPLLPLEEWNYRMHAGEIFVSKPNLPPAVEDISHCIGDEDPKCIAGEEPSQNTENLIDYINNISWENPITNAEYWVEGQGLWPISPRYRLWELFFAHRDYFWRLGLCAPWGDPKDWWRKYPFEGALPPDVEPHDDL